MSSIVNIMEESTLVTDSSPSAIIVTGMMGPPGTNKLSTAQDIDTTHLEEGSLLIYRTSTQKWTSSRHLNSQILDAGEF